ncbi:hypothetical protein FQN55_002940 [Onygenales sp. PD_40]|nr:hypothetical protein FQN55_002940 [Onygenales sp. PD_40]
MSIYIKDSDRSGTPTELRRETTLQATTLEDATSERKQSCSSENNQDRHKPDLKEESGTECAKDGPEPSHGSSADEDGRLEVKGTQAISSPNPPSLSESSQSTVIDHSTIRQATPTPERDLLDPEVTPTPQMASRYTTRARAHSRQPAGTQICGEAAGSRASRLSSSPPKAWPLQGGREGRRYHMSIEHSAGANGCTSTARLFAQINTALNRWMHWQAGFDAVAICGPYSRDMRMLED